MDRDGVCLDPVELGRAEAAALAECSRRVAARRSLREREERERRRAEEERAALFDWEDSHA